jgi:hypothetical protein
MGGNSSKQTLKEYITNSADFQSTVKTTLNLTNTSQTSVRSVNNLSIVNGGSACCTYPTTTTTTTMEQDPAFPNDKTKTKPKVTTVTGTGTLPNCDPTKLNPTMNCKNFTIGQSISSNVNVINSVDSSYTQNLASKIQETASNQISDTLKNAQTNDLLSGFGNKSKQDIEDTINNSLKVVLTKEVVTNIVNSAVATQNMENKSQILNCGTFGTPDTDCTFDQNIAINLLVNNILSSIANVVSNDATLADYANKLLVVAEQEQTGPIGAFFKAIGTIGIVIISIIAGVIFLIMIVGLFLLLRGSGGSSYPPPMGFPPMGYPPTGFPPMGYPPTMIRPTQNLSAPVGYFPTMQ